MHCNRPACISLNRPSYPNSTHLVRRKQKPDDDDDDEFRQNKPAHEQHVPVNAGSDWLDPARIRAALSAVPLPLGADERQQQSARSNASTSVRQLAQRIQRWCAGASGCCREAQQQASRQGACSCPKTCAGGLVLSWAWRLLQDCCLIWRPAAVERYETCSHSAAAWPAARSSPE